MEYPTVTATGSIRGRYDVIGKDARDPLTPSPESFPMNDARIQSRDAPAATETLHEATSRALAARRYTTLAALAARRVTAPTVLDTSAPLRAIGRGSELVVTMTFAPASREFVAATAEDGGVPETPAEDRERAHAVYGTALDCEEAAASVIAYDKVAGARVREVASGALWGETIAHRFERATPCPIAQRAPDCRSPAHTRCSKNSAAEDAWTTFH
jgi:hypothetical protein